MMSHCSQQSAPGEYPSPVTAYPPAGPNASGPPPMGYPTKDGPLGYPQQTVPPKTASRGDGFWKGCLAAVCCCCVLDCCL